MPYVLTPFPGPVLLLAPVPVHDHFPVDGVRDVGEVGDRRGHLIQVLLVALFFGFDEIRRWNRGCQSPDPVIEQTLVDVVCDQVCRELDMDKGDPVVFSDGKGE